MSKTKGDGLVFKTLEREPRVLEYDNHGMDEGRFMVVLAPGYAFDGAAPLGDDGSGTSHCSSFGSVREVVEALKWVEPCFCTRCAI